MKLHFSFSNKKQARLITILFLTLLIVIIFEIMSIYYSRHETKTHFDSRVKLDNIRSKTTQVFEYIRENVNDIIISGGIKGAIQLTQEAFKQEAITMYQCHTLAHTIGHHSNPDISEDIHILIENGVDYCEGGFKHGLEAEIALRGLEGDYNFRPEIYRFCSFLLEKSTVGDCYHGAGHEFMGYTLDVKKALDLCDTLTEGPLKDVTNCYTGLFSEYTNILGGVDGETGYRIANPILKLDSSPMDFCASLDKPYQIPCALELNGLYFGTSSTYEMLEEKLRGCINPKYNQELQIACIKSTSAVFYQHQLPKEHSPKPPDYILSWAEEPRRAFIVGAGTEMNQFLINGVKIDWQTFCQPFPSDEFSLCRSIFEKTS